MESEIEYILIAALVAVMTLTVGGIGYGAKCRSDAAETEGQKLSDAFATLRDGTVSETVERLLSYISEERQLEPQLSIADLLAHALPTEDLRVLETVGETRAELRRLASQVKMFANLSRHLFIIPFIGFPAIFIPLALNLEFANALWYASWGLATFGFGTAGLGCIYVFHNKKVAFEERLSGLKIDGVE